MNLSDFMTNPNASVARSARMVEQYRKEFDAGDLTKTQYADLCNDATDLTKIDADALTVEERVLAQAALKEILSLALSFA